MKKFVLGDIHGGYKALLQVLERSGFDYENDLLITLGDIVDGWGGTYDCVEELLKIKNRIDIVGNHDEWFQIFLTKSYHPDNWRQGGRSTVESYAKAVGIKLKAQQTTSGYLINLIPEDIPETHKKFFKNQIPYYVDDQNRAFVHAGYYYGLGEDDFMTYTLDRDLWTRDALPGHKSQNLPIRLRLYKKIFIGHTTTLRWNTDKPMYRCNVWNLDTGGGYGGKLTIMNVDTEEYWQSDKLKELYPNEEGR